MHETTTRPRAARTFSSRRARSVFSAPVSPSLLSSLTDEALLAALLGRESEPLWRTFLARFERLIVSSILRAARFGQVVLAEPDVEDIRSSFLVALLARDRHMLRAFDPGRGVKVSTWIALLAMRHGRDCIKVLRTRGRYETPEMTPKAERLLATRRATPAEIVEQRELFARMRGALSALPERQRELYELYFRLDMEPEEVASRMRTTVQTVHSCRHKIEKRLVQVVLGRGGARLAA
ncbi:MAG: sigma-70 family RNA polymerase sigma factor [Polyangiaceae bacterium]